ncbi:MAG: hypothetical protein BMS9Abin37_1216 [Acidobacteriota bacterium]|nr:MAG: hypothetical protein BMS9Abin37_1216 [Acidobacteriota bacterium]
MMIAVPMPYTGRLETTPLLDIVQTIAYSQQSGLLSVKGSDTKGLLIFQNGNIICAYSPSALSLLVKAAKEQEPDNRLALRRIQVLTALRELFDIGEGDYRFVKKAEPIAELEGLDMRLFYASGPLDTGDLLLVLETAMDEMHGQPQNIQVQVTRTSPSESNAGTEGRGHPRYGPIVIQATLAFAGTTVIGYLTSLSVGGTFFHADQFPGPDSECELGFELPWEFGHCQAQAKVAWLRSEGPDTRRGVGLSFLELSPESKGRLAAYLERFQELAADVDFQA